MNTLTNSTFKSSLVSITLHASVVVIGSFVIFKTPVKSLELSGAGGRGSISLSSFNLGSKKTSNPNAMRPVRTEMASVKTQTVSTQASAVSSAVSGGTGSGDIHASAGPSSDTGNGSGTGTGTGNGHDFDQGKLFSQIKVFFENRLGSTLNITVEQLIKIKVTLGSDGEILSADLVQGKLEFQAMKKVLNVAKNIPLKNFWKSSAPYPQEMIIPLVLSPG